MKSFVLFLTLSRIISGPLIFIFTVFLNLITVSMLIFIIASITDFLDGKLARDYDVESSLGATLDPIADKILVLFALFTLTVLTCDIFIASMTSLILAREFWVSGMREHASNIARSEATKVSILGKTKTTFQFFAISLYFIGFSFDFALMVFISHFFLVISVLMAYKSAIEYSQKSLSS